MTIGIIGSGNVGGALGTGWAKAGNQVIFGSRKPQSDDIRQLLAQAGPNARAASFQEAKDAADIVLISTPWKAAQPTLASLGDFGGKVLIDVLNPLLPDLSGLDIGATTSAGEQVATWARGAKVVKTLNSVGFNIMANSNFGSDRPVMFYCGDDAAAKQSVQPLIEQLGFDPIDAGPLRQARLLEPFALLWISLAYGQGFGREIAFKFLRR